MRRIQIAELPSLGLTSFVLGLIISPFIYIGIGALFQFSFMFSLVFLPPLLLGSGFLFWRHFAKQKRHLTNKSILTFEVLSWIVVVLFLIFISRFNLMTISERAGLFCTFFLFSSVVGFPLVLLHETVFEQQVKQFPGYLIILLFFLILLITSTVMVVYLTAKPSFI